MNHRHRKVLHAFFAHPINANIHVRDAENLFGELGAEISHVKSGRMHVALNGNSANFSVPHHSFPKGEVMQIRKFLEACDVDPERDYPL
ncbi:MAG: hypothetical protein HKN05_11205 [Rhizobiales bacterium]|nr:hypothetical protein [Hyphomicrobiales bacterium]